MVFDVTIRPTGRVGLQPVGGLKRFTRAGLWDVKTVVVVYAAHAVALQRLLGKGGWADRTGGQPSKSRV